MKKRIYHILNIILITSFIFLIGCSAEPLNLKRLSIENEKAYVKDINIKNYYVPVGKEVIVKTYCLTDVDLAMYIDGEFYSYQTAQSNGDEWEWVYTFIMPDSDISISFKVVAESQIYLQTMYFNNDASNIKKDFDFKVFCDKFNLENNYYSINNIENFAEVYFDITGNVLENKLRKKIESGIENYYYLVYARNINTSNKKTINYIYDINKKQIIQEYPHKNDEMETISYYSIEIVQLPKNYF